MRIPMLATVVVAALGMFAVEPIPPLLRHVPEVRSAAAPLIRGEAAVIARIPSLTEFEIEQLDSRNRSAVRPYLTGVIRDLAEPVKVGAGVRASAIGPWRWSGRVAVDEGPADIRLRLDNLQAHQSARFWVYSPSSSAAPVAFDASLAYGGTLWTPSVFASDVVLVVEASQAVSFDVTAVAVSRLPKPDGAACLQDAACDPSPALADIGTGIALMLFMTPEGPSLCTGGLMNDRAGTFTPHFLTAHHCISTAAEAATLQTFWDFRSGACNNAAPNLDTRPRVIGATLLASAEAGDVSLLRLSGSPAGRRFFLGWDPRSVAVGTNLHRISHPGGDPQRYSVSQVETTSAACLGAGRPTYLYSRPTFGAVIGGSSGSPVLTNGGHVVGQLLGHCPNFAEPCGTVTRTIDGALAATWPLLAPFLDPQVGCAACVPGATTACLLGNRFKVDVRWRNGYLNPAPTGNGRVIRYAENKPEVHPTLGPLTESAFFEFFAPARVELVVKLLSGVGINNKYWVFVSSLASNEYTVKITDTATCKTWERSNSHGSFSPINDFEAFALP